MQKISEVMSTDVQTISPDARIEEAAQEMRDGDFGLLPVAEEEELLGAITDRDIPIRAVARQRPKHAGEGNNVRGGDLGPRGRFRGRCGTGHERHQIRRLPIVDGDQRLVGMCRWAILRWTVRISDPWSRRSRRFETSEQALLKNIPESMGCFYPSVSLPLDRRGRFAGDVVDDAVDAAHFVDDPVRHFRQQLVRQLRPVGGHEVARSAPRAAPPRIRRCGRRPSPRPIYRQEHRERLG